MRELLTDTTHKPIAHEPTASIAAPLASEEADPGRGDGEDFSTGVMDADEGTEQDTEQGTATETAPPSADRLPPYRVLLHNDDINDMVDVVNTITELTPHGREKAVEIMLRAHMSGRSLLLVTHKERAELYRDQFRCRKLTVTIERAH